MDKVLSFMGEHPFLTVIVGSMILGTLVKLVPWAKRDRNED
jgi:hypothetical protein